MKIAFVTETPVADVNAFSGSTHNMYRALKASFEHVEVVELPHHSELSGSTEKKLRVIGRLATEAVERLGVDAVICQGASALPYFESRIPATFWHDSLWAVLYQGHFDDIHLSFDEFARQFPELRRWDELALKRADVVIFAADWLVESAVQFYGVDREKLKVVPFGANVEGAKDAEEAASIARARPGSPCQLLFLGKDWVRKGLRKAVALADRLNAEGLETVLTTIGCAPTGSQLRKNPHTRHLGVLNKSKRKGRVALESAIKQAHFLVHPARFECFGCSLAEANAHAVPVLGTAVTGLKTIVRPGVNGMLYDGEAFVEKAAAFVQDVMGDYEARYQPLAQSSFAEYERRLNWTTSGLAVRQILEQVVAANRG